MKVSYTKLQMFLQCPLKYCLRYIERRPERKSWPFTVLGTALHDAIRDFERLPSDARRTPQVLEDLLRHHWAKQDRSGFKSKEHEGEWGRKGLAMVRHYFYVVADRERPWLCEAEISVQFPKFHLAGRVDQLHQMRDGGATLVELKSGDYLASQEEVDNSLQVTMYALGITHQFGIAPEELSIVLWQLAAQRKLITSRSAEQLAAATSEIGGIVNRIQEETSFDPTPNAFCQWCDYLQICPVHRHAE